MGTWGPAPFSDDTARDVRDAYTEYIGDGLSGPEAMARLLEEWSSSLGDPDEEPVLWLSLAATQWRLGRLDETTKARALDVIHTGSDLRRWQDDPVALRKRQGVLQKLLAQLVSPQPPPRKVARRFRNACDWPIGEVIAYARPARGTAVFRVIGHHSDRGGTAPVVEFLKWTQPAFPDPAVTKRLRVLTSRQGQSQFMLGATSAREIPVDRLTRLGVVGSPSRAPAGFTVLLWRMLDDYLEESFDEFRSPG